MSVIKANGAGSAASDFYSYKIDQSLRFNDGDSVRLRRTPASAGDLQKFTYSVWFKRNNLNAEMDLFSAGNSSTDRFEIILSAAYPDQLEIYMNTSGTVGDLVTTQKFRDVSAWYHLVVAFDTTQGTAANRVKVYINGSQITSFATETYPSQNFNTAVNSTSNHFISKRSYVDDRYYDGYMAEVNMIDGQQLTPASFGETKDGVWVPKDASGLTFGTNGFYLPFKSDAVSEGFNVVTYLGTGQTQSISGLGFAPDLVWGKERDNAESHWLFDSARGATKQIQSNDTGSESDQNTMLTSFDGDGFSLGDDGAGNQSDTGYVAWCWEAGGAPTADNSAGAGATPTAGSVKIDGSNLGSALGGSIAATRLTANTSKGFSVVSYTGNGTSGATVAHGLSAAPDWILVKVRSGSSGDTNWRVYHSAINEEHHLLLNDKAAKTGQTNIWNDTAPTSTVFSLGNHVSVNENNSTTIAYCWHDVSGYSKFGSYTGDGSSSNAVTGLGFKPAWLMVKRVDTETTYSNWWIQDSTRSPSNAVSKVQLAADVNDAETTALEVDFDSDGFTLKDASQGSNISSGTYIYMAFADTREAAFFKDASGQGHNFTPNNLDYRDVLLDSPTNNFATMNQLLTDTSNTTFSEGNLKTVNSGASTSGSSIAVNSGKWFVEMICTAKTATNAMVGICTVDGFDGERQLDESQNGGSGHGYVMNATKLPGGASYGASWAVDDVIGIALDLDSSQNTVTFYKNGSTQGAIDIDNALYVFCNSNGQGSSTVTYVTNFGQDGTFAGEVVAGGNADGGGVGDFKYSVPSGYLALCTKNLPDPTIGPTASTLATDNFNTVLWTGNGSSQNITGVGFQPDWLWIKNRTNTDWHNLIDVVRGSSKRLASNNTTAEYDDSSIVSGFASDGFGIGSNSNSNKSGYSFVGWNWKAGGSASSNSDGDITSSVSANTAAGFSIVSFEGTGSAATVGHGLSAAAEMVIVKNRENASGLWLVYHAGIASDAETDYLHLESTNAAADDNSAWNDTAPTSSVFSVGTSVASNESGKDIIAYCFHSVEGYSKVGSYTGNGNADGAFIFTGFRPSFLLVRRADGISHWLLFDDVRHPSNVNDLRLFANLANTEDSSYALDFLSNGFKLRHTGSDFNTSGGTYIYLAFAEAPFKFSNAL